jgi:hypothetical protein
MTRLNCRMSGVRLYSTKFASYLWKTRLNWSKRFERPRLTLVVTRFQKGNEMNSAQISIGVLVISRCEC